MLKKETLLQEITNYYIDSPDFNGLPTYSMESYDYSFFVS